MLKTIRENVFRITVFIGVLFCFIPLYASAKDDLGIVKIGVVQQKESNISINNSIDEFYGVHLDYLTNIAEVLNLKIELHAYSNIPKLLDDIENGTLNGAVGFSQTPERSAKFIFSKPLFTSTIAVWYQDKNFMRAEPRVLHWVCVDGTVYCEQLEQIGANNIKRVGSYIEAFDEVQSGRANALVLTYVAISKYLDEHNIINGAVDIPSWLREEEVRFIASESNQMLIDKIDTLLSWKSKGKNIRTVASTDPYHVNDNLLMMYRRDSKSNRPITYSSSTDAFPFLYINPKTDQLDGFLIDFFNLVQSRTGLKFRYLKPEKSLSSGLTAFDANIVPVAFVNQPSSLEWLITKPFMHNKFVSVQSENGDKHPVRNNKSGILMSMKKQGLIHLGSWQSKDTIRYDDLSLLLSDLKAGKVNVAYVPEDIVHVIVAQGNAEDLLFSEKKAITVFYAFAVSQHNARLQALLNSIINTIDDKEIEKLARAHQTFRLTYGYDQSDILKVGLLAVAFITVLLIIVYFVLDNLKLKVSLAELNATSEEKEKQWLTQVIREINSVIFIHAENSQIQMSNCAKYLESSCNGCAIRNKQNGELLVDNQKEIAQVLNGARIEESLPTKDCAIGMQYVYRERKAIASPISHSKYVLTVIQDISVQKERERELICAQEKAQSAVRARERFLATMSHELRTPLSATHGLLDLLTRRIHNHSDLELISQAMRSLSHLNSLVDEILDYSKLEAGELQVTPGKTNVLSALCDIARTFEPKVVSKQLDFRVSIQPFKSQWVSIDATRLLQVVTNVLSNAVKFTSEGGIRVDFAIKEQTLLIKVADSGIGMSEEQLQRVFQPFVQADGSITREYGGTGLGLTIVEQLVECMQGSFVIDSLPDVGTTVTITLPVVPCDSALQPVTHLSYSNSLPEHIRCWCAIWDMQQNESSPNLAWGANSNGDNEGVVLRLDSETDGLWLSADEVKYPDLLFKALTQSKPSDRATSNSVHWKQGTVLVAEDNEINQKLILMQLRELGIEPAIVSNGMEAWEFVSRKNDVILVLTDFHMPVMNGFELARRIKDSGSVSDIPVICMTAEDSRLADEQAKQSGIDEILYKPYNVESLESKLIPFIGEPEVATVWLDKFPEQEACEIAVVFVDAMTRDIENLNTAPGIQSQKKVIHRIKGAAGSVGLSGLYDLCKNAERAQESEFERYVSDLIAQLKQEINVAEQWSQYL